MDEATLLSIRAAQNAFSALFKQKAQVGMWGWILEELGGVVGDEYHQNIVYKIFKN